MQFDFLHRPPRKGGRNSWYQNTLLLAVAGSIIAVIGQLAGTVIPIMYGPQDIEDFNVNLDTASIIVDGQSPISKYPFEYINITINDLHRWLRPYRFKIQFRALGSINEAYAIFDPPEIQLPARFEMGKSVRSYWMHPDRHGNRRYTYSPSDTTTAYIDINTSSTPIGDYPIIIQCIGSNGKTHNSTFTLRIVDHETYLRYLKGWLIIKGEKIHI